MSVADRARAATGHGNGSAPPPHDVGAEKDYLGSLYHCRGEELAAAIARLSSDDFYVSDHQRLFRVLAKMAEEGLNPRDAPSIFRTRAPDLERLLAECWDRVPSPVDIEVHARVVKSAARARKYLELVHTLEADVRNPKRWSQIDQRMLEHLEHLGPVPDDLKAPPPFAAHFVCADDVVPKAVEWLWYPYIPRGKITFLTGDPGDGKTLFAVWLASRLTRGRAFPGHELDPETPIQGNVIYLTNEDGMEDTMRPRLEAADADLKRVKFLKGALVTDEKGTREIDITLMDFERLEKQIAEQKAVLLVVDPVQAFIDPSVDMNRANEVRGQLRRLVELSDRHRMTILMLRHRGKSTQTRGKHSGLGSVDFTGIARSELITAEEPQREDRALIFHAKSNVAKKGAAISYQIDGAYAGTIETAVFNYLGTSEWKIDDVLNPSNRGRSAKRREDCEAWLRLQLLPGPLPAAELTERAEQAGFSEKTLRRAGKNLGVVRERVSAGNAGEGRWVVRLPDDGEGGGERRDVDE